MRRKYDLDLGVRAWRRGPFPPTPEPSKEGWSDVERSTLSSQVSRVRSNLHFWAMLSRVLVTISFLPSWLSFLLYCPFTRSRRKSNGNECTFLRCTVPSSWLQRQTGPEYNHRDFPECVARRIGPLSLFLSLSLSRTPPRNCISDVKNRAWIKERGKTVKSRNPPFLKCNSVFIPLHL